MTVWAIDHIIICSTSAASRQESTTSNAQAQSDNKIPCRALYPPFIPSGLQDETHRARDQKKKREKKKKHPKIRCWYQKAAVRLAPDRVDGPEITAIKREHPDQGLARKPQPYETPVGRGRTDSTDHTPPKLSKKKKRKKSCKIQTPGANTGNRGGVPRRGHTRGGRVGGRHQEPMSRCAVLFERWEVRKMIRFIQTRKVQTSSNLHTDDRASDR